MAIADFFNNMTSAVGQFWNNISGTTAQNEFNAKQAEISFEREKELRNTYYQDTIADMKKSGINPVVGGVGSASTGASVPTASASLGAGSGTVTGILDSTARLLNANDNTKNRRVQQSVYNSAGKLIKLVVTKQR